MSYRLYAPADFDALYAIEELCFEPPHRFSRSYMRGLVRAANAATWIAEQEGAMAGFAIVEWSRDGVEILAYLQTIEVDPRYRGCGIARELLRRAESSALAAGAQSLWLHVEEQNQPAIRLYQSAGYLCRGREENYYGRGRSGLVYSRRLA